MSSVEPRVRELFSHIRRAIDIIEELTLRPPVGRAQQSEEQQERQSPAPESFPKKLAYSIKEVRELMVISNSLIYKEIGDGRLRAVRRGNRTMILALDFQDWISRWPVSRISKEPI